MTARPLTSLQTTAISPVEDIVADMRAGRMVILIDEEDRENEGDLVLAADHVTAEAVNFMARFGRGLICLTLTRERCELLQLPPMVTRNGTKHATAFTVSIEAAEGSPRVFLPLTGRAQYRPQLPKMRKLMTWFSPAIFFPCRRLTAAC